MRVALAQINTTVGDRDGNVEKILKYAADASDLACDVVAFPELAITGYPPEDLLRRRDFVRANHEALKRVAADAPGDVALVVGFVDGEDQIYNAAAIIENGRIAHVYHKQLLPNYGVFDEQRYFARGDEASTYDIAGTPGGGRGRDDIREAGEGGIGCST